mgnify:FL=1
MTSCKNLVLYGSLAARELAKITLEDQPQVRRIDASADLTQLRLVLSPALTEKELIPLLAKSGISGFRLDRASPS